MHSLAHLYIIHALFYIHSYIHLYRFKRRLDPFDTTDKEFWARYRFTKDSVRRLAALVFPNPVINDRGKPFTREQVTCLALHLMAGANFQRVEGLCVGGSKSSAHRLLYRFVDGLRLHKATYVQMPTREEMDENARAIFAKYHIWNAVGV